MAIKRNRRFHPEIPTSSLSDIMFFMILFFLIISTLANPNVIKLTLPKASTNETTNKDHISISVTEDQRYFPYCFPHSTQQGFWFELIERFLFH